MSSENPVTISLLSNRKQERKVIKMDLTDQKVSGSNQICLQDSLNSALLEIKVEMGADTVAPATDDLIIFVDTESSNTPTENRKQYVLNLSESLKYFNQTGDVYSQKIEIDNNDVRLKSIVTRKVGTNESGYYILDTPILEDVESIPMTLFEGINYIYTNYTNVIISLTYPKNNDLNRLYLNNSIFSEHKKNANDDFSMDDIYFKDAFTKTGDNLNFEVNNASVDCITSRNNKFSLDSDGNLTVNSINANQANVNNQIICDLIYPVGSIYLSIGNTCPATLFGGTWEKIKDRFLLGCGDTYSNGSTGGSSNHNHTTQGHTLTSNEIPDHSHVIDGWAVKWGNGTGTYINSSMCGGAFSQNNPYVNVNSTVGAGGGLSHSHGNTGTSSNMPPYLAVCMWKRTA